LRGRPRGWWDAAPQQQREPDDAHEDRAIGDVEDREAEDMRNLNVDEVHHVLARRAV
jgi:hypothetical protein